MLLPKEIFIFHSVSFEKKENIVGSMAAETTRSDLKRFSLIWLDDPLYSSEENLLGQKDLRSSIDQLQTFANDTECEKYILSLSPSDRSILLINCRWAALFIPRIHQLRQISSISIRCLDKEAHEGLAKQFAKV